MLSPCLQRNPEKRSKGEIRNATETCRNSLRKRIGKGIEASEPVQQIDARKRVCRTRASLHRPCVSETPATNIYKRSEIKTLWDKTGGQHAVQGG